jgi:hypothetical protein
MLRRSGQSITLWDLNGIITIAENPQPNLFEQESRVTTDPKIEWNGLQIPVSAGIVQAISDHELVKAFEETASRINEIAEREMNVIDSLWDVHAEPLYKGLSWLAQRAKVRDVKLPTPQTYQGESLLRRRWLRAMDPMAQPWVEELLAH